MEREQQRADVYFVSVGHCTTQQQWAKSGLLLGELTKEWTLAVVIVMELSSKYQE